MTGGQQEEQQASVEAAGRQLSASVRLILQLVQYGVGMSADDMAVLRKHLSPQVRYGCSGVSVCQTHCTPSKVWRMQQAIQLGL